MSYVLLVELRVKPGNVEAFTEKVLANAAAARSIEPGCRHFDVIVDPNVINGTVISNQGFVTAVDHGIVDVPSDDPTTPIANDPTRDIVGNLPLLYAEKRVELLARIK